MYPINEDSVLNVFSNALNKLHIPLKMSFNENKCDTSFHNNRLLKLKKVNQNTIKKMAYSDQNTTIILPYIYIDNMSMKHMYVTSSGVPGGGYYLRDTFLKIAIYIIKNDEIIYLNAARFGPVSSETATFDEEPPNKLTQENWDKLVELVMKDYVKRLN